MLIHIKITRFLEVSNFILVFPVASLFLTFIWGEFFQYSNYFRTIVATSLLVVDTDILSNTVLSFITLLIERREKTLQHTNTYMYNNGSFITGFKKKV